MKQSFKLQEKDCSNKFAFDCLQFFKGKQGVDIDQYSYGDQSGVDAKSNEVSGAEIWAQYLKSAKNYYPFYAEVEILKNNMSDIMSIIGEGADLLEFGPGPQYSVQEKTSRFFNKPKSFKSYTAVDLSQDYLDQSKSYISEHCPNIKMDMVQGDFFNDFILLKSVFVDKKVPVVLMLGNTIANIPEMDGEDFPNNLFRFIRRLKNNLPSGAMFVFGHDINQDESSIINTYNHPLFIEHELSVFKRMKNDINIKNLDDEAFQLNFNWNAQKFCLDVYANSSRPQKINILGQNIVLQSETKLHITKSYKYPVELMNAIGTQAGFKPIAHFKDSSDRMAIHVWKC